MGVVVEQLWAFLAVDETGDEGLPAFLHGDTMLPMVAADGARLDSLREVAEQISKVTGQSFKLCRFSVREEIEVIGP